MTYTCGVAVIGSGVGCLANAAKVPLRARPLCTAPLNVVTAHEIKSIQSLHAIKRQKFEKY